MLKSWFLKKILKTDNATLSILFGNLVVLIGVIFVNWDAKGVFVAYVAETLIIGVIHVFKMLIVLFANPAERKYNGNKPNSAITGFFAIPFFIIHYGFFCFIQSALFFSFAGDDGASVFNAFGGYVAYFQKQDTLYAFLTITASNFFYFLNDFVWHRKYQDAKIAAMFFQPYPRVIVQQVVILMGGMLLLLSGGAKIFACFFILFKTFIDLVGAAAKRDIAFRELLIKSATKNKKEEDEMTKTINNIFGKDKK